MPKVHRFQAALGGDEGERPLVELPFDVNAEYGSARAKVKATVSRVELRTTVAVYGGRSSVGFRNEIRDAAGIAIGDRITVRIEPDEGPCEVELPADLASALRTDAAARKAFDALAFTHRKEYAAWVSEAKKPETRAGLVAKTLEMLRAGVEHPDPALRSAARRPMMPGACRRPSNSCSRKPGPGSRA